MKIAALIPARSKSKRLPLKNIKLLNGKPLLFWSIDTALEANCFSIIAVSSESDEILNLVRSRYSSEEVFTIKRPNELAKDNSDLIDVCRHFLNRYEQIEFLALMMPTYPFRSAKRIAYEIIPHLYSRQIDRVVSVRYGNFSTFDYWIPHGKNDFCRMYTNMPLWCGAGNSTYSIQRREYYFLPHHKWPIRSGERTLRIQNNFVESIDIDTEENFNEAEKICAGFTPRFRNLWIHEYQDIEFVSPVGSDLISFLHLLEEKKIKTDLPILILRPADPIFNFLRWYECNTTGQYIPETTRAIIAKLPSSGNSQDFPVHFIHSQYYRVLRKEHDKNGILDDVVPESQVLFETDLKNEWPDYIDPVEWIAPKKVD